MEPETEIEGTLGYVLIATAPGKTGEVCDAVKKYESVKEVHPIFGQYDLIAKVFAKDFTDLGCLVVDKIRTIPGVTDTCTLPGIVLDSSETKQKE